MHRLSKLAQTYFPYLFLLIVVLCSIAPVFSTFTTAYIGDGGDSLEMLSYIKLVKQNIQQGSLPFSYTNTFRYPYGFDFNFGADPKLFAFIGGVLNFFLNDVVTYNFMIVLIILANCVASYIFFYYLTASRKMGIIGAIIYGASCYPLTKMGGHINLMQIYGIPIVATSLVMIIREQKIYVLSLLVFICGFFLVCLSSLQTGLLVCVALLGLCLVGLLVYPKKCLDIYQNTMLSSERLVLLLLWLCFMVFLVLLFPSHIAYLIKAGMWNVSIQIGRTTPIYVDFLPTLYNRMLFSDVFYGFISVSDAIQRELRTIGAATFWGYLEMMLFLVAVSTIRSKRTVFYFLLFLLFYALSLGPIYSNVPIVNGLFFIFPFKYIMETDRYFVLYYFIVTIFVVELLHVFTLNKYVYSILIAFFVFERIVFPQTFTIAKEEYTHVVQTLPGQAVLDVPVLFQDPQYFEGVRYNILPFFYKKSIVNGYFHWMGETDKSSAFITSNKFVQLLRCGTTQSSITDTEYHDAISEMIALGITSLVVHKEYYWYRDECEQARINSVSLLGDITRNEAGIDESMYDQTPKFSRSLYIQRIYTDEKVIIYSITYNLH